MSPGGGWYKSVGVILNKVLCLVINSDFFMENGHIKIDYGFTKYLKCIE